MEKSVVSFMPWRLYPDRVLGYPLDRRLGGIRSENFAVQKELDLEKLIVARLI
jgi:hypothetical protein